MRQLETTKDIDAEVTCTTTSSGDSAALNCDVLPPGAPRTWYSKLVWKPQPCARNYFKNGRHPKIQFPKIQFFKKFIEITFVLQTKKYLNFLKKFK